MDLNKENIEYFKNHPDEFIEQAPTAVLEKVMEDENLPDTFKRDARNEYFMRKHGRAIIGVPRENDDGSLMKREDGEVVAHFAYTKGNVRTSNIPEILCFYPSQSNLKFLLNTVSDKIRAREIPWPVNLPQILENAFDDGTPIFYYLLGEEERKKAQEEYVCQLDEESDVLHLIVPATDGNIQLQWIPDELRPYGLEAKPMKASFFAECITKMWEDLEKESCGLSEPLVVDEEVSKTKPGLIPRIDYSKLRGLEKGTDEYGRTHFGIAVQAYESAIQYLLYKQLKNESPSLPLGTLLDKCDEIIKPFNSMFVESFHELPKETLGEVIKLIIDSNQYINILPDGELCLSTHEELSNIASKDDNQETDSSNDQSENEDDGFDYEKWSKFDDERWSQFEIARKEVIKNLQKRWKYEDWDGIQRSEEWFGTERISYQDIYFYTVGCHKMIALIVLTRYMMKRASRYYREIGNDTGEYYAKDIDLLMEESSIELGTLTGDKSKVETDFCNWLFWGACHIEDDQQLAYIWRLVGFMKEMFESTLAKVDARLEKNEGEFVENVLHGQQFYLGIKLSEIIQNRVQRLLKEYKSNIFTSSDDNHSSGVAKLPNKEYNTSVDNDKMNRELLEQRIIQAYKKQRLAMEDEGITEDDIIWGKFEFEDDLLIILDTETYRQQCKWSEVDGEIKLGDPEEYRYGNLSFYVSYTIEVVDTKGNSLGSVSCEGACYDGFGDYCNPILDHAVDLEDVKSALSESEEDPTRELDVVNYKLLSVKYDEEKSEYSYTGADDWYPSGIDGLDTGGNLDSAEIGFLAKIEVELEEEEEDVSQKSTMTTTYSLPVNQTLLVQYMVEVTTEQGEEYGYYVFQSPEGGTQPAIVASEWCKEDEAADESGDSPESTFTTEYGVFDNPDCKTHEDINLHLQRHHGDSVEIKGDRIYVDHLEYDFIPATEFLDGTYPSLEEWAKDNELDLKIH